MNIVGQDKPSIEEVFAHAGVKGMRWGVRKKRRESMGAKVDKFNNNLGRLVRTVSYVGALAVGVKFVTGFLEEASGVPLSAVVPDSDRYIDGV